MTALPRLASLLGMAVALILSAFGALASERNEQGVRAWVAEIDGSANWWTHFSDISSRGSKTFITGLKIVSVPRGIVVSIDEITFTGRITTDGGEITAASIVAGDAAIATDGLRIELGEVDLARATLPDITGFGWNDARPLTSTIRAYALLSGLSMASGSIASIDLIESDANVESRITYTDIEISDWSDGKISALDIGRMRMDTPSPDGVVGMSVDRFSATGIDLDAFVHAFDPARYVNERGDGAWRTAVDTAVYEGIVIKAPDAETTVARMMTEDLKVRQAPRSFVRFVDDALENPALMNGNGEVARRAYEILSSFAIGRFTIDEVDIAAAGIDEIKLQRFTLADASSEHIGEFSLDGLKTTVRGEGFIDLSRLAIGGIDLPPAAAVLAAINDDARGRPVETERLTPRPGWIEIAGLDVQSLSLPRTSLGRLRADFGAYEGQLPTSLELEVADLRVAASLVNDKRAREMLEGLGYETVDADFGFKVRWDPRDASLRLDDIHFSMREFGALEAEARLAGLDRGALGGLGALRDSVMELEFSSGAMTFQDDSVVTRGLAMQARRLQLDTEVFRQQIAGALPFMLSFVGTPEFQRQIVPVLQTFLRTPGRITITARPDNPISLGDLEATFRQAPQTLPALLSITLGGEAGDGGEALRRTIGQDE